MTHPQPRSALDPSGVPEPLRAAIGACEYSSDLITGLGEMAAAFGFDGFSFLLLAPRSPAPALSLHWTTAGPDWCRRYASRGYHFMDSRIIESRGRNLPIVWDSARHDADPRIRSFLADAGQAGIRSGVALSIVDAHMGRAVVAWDSRMSPVSETRQCAIRNSLANLTFLANFVHESVFARCRSALVDAGAGTLSSRERQCLTLAAHGMTSADIGVKLAITERTVNFHIGNTIGKLGVLNRGEAIARAVSLNLVALRY